MVIIVNVNYLPINSNFTNMRKVMRQLKDKFLVYDL